MINQERLWHRLQSLAQIGADPAGGITRPGFSAAHAQAVHLVAGWMRAAGLTPFLDRTGNLFGVSGGLGDSSPVLAAGSHLDTVPNGGLFDGALGVLGALEAVQSLSESGAVLRQPMAVIGFADEEGNNFGVGCLSSQLLINAIPESKWGELKDRGGRTLSQYINSFLSKCNLPIAVPPPLAAFVELHVEQGPLLESQRRPAAAVTSIVGISRTTVRFAGEANHGGTTPMHLRRDALCGAAELVLAVRELGRNSAAQAVTTVGVFEVRPGATNVIPGEVELRVEMRSSSEPLLSDLRATVERLSAELASLHRLDVVIQPWHHAPGAPMHTRVVESVQRAMTQLGLEPYAMPSWAGHDAKILTRQIPTGMIFVPSKGGWSHSPLEATDPADCACGAAILARTLLGLSELKPGG